MKTGVLRLRKPIPLARSIRWVPSGMSSRPEAIEDLALFITQGALRDVMRHLRSDPEQELLGFLLGELFECPDTGARYVVINAAVRTGYAIPEVEPVQIPEEEWLGLQLEVRRRRTTLIGWYHSAPFVGARPARLDLETHRARFPEPWQCGLVIATAGDAPAGGFFRPLPGGLDAGGVFIRFLELLDDDALPEGAPKRTLIDWVNYETQEPVERDTSARRPHIPPPASHEPAIDAFPAALAVMFPPPPTADDVAPPPPPPAGRGRRLKLGALIVLALAGAAAGIGYIVWNQRDIVEPPANAAIDLPSATHSTATRPPAAPKPTSTPSITAPASSLSTQAATAPSSTATPAGTPRSSDSSTATTATSPAAPITSTTNPKLLQFDTLADSLEQAIRNFHDRNADFALSRLTCNGLAVGYRSADDAFIALAGMYRGVRDQLDSARDARYRSLERGMATVNAEFDQSKCPRP